MCSSGPSPSPGPGRLQSCLTSTTLAGLLPIVVDHPPLVVPFRGIWADTSSPMLPPKFPGSWLKETSGRGVDPPEVKGSQPEGGQAPRLAQPTWSCSGPGSSALRRPRKQRHTAKRIFERLRDEYGFDGGYTTVKDYVRENRRQTKEMFVPLSHAPGHAQCDFGEALVVIGGVERKAHCFVIDLPHSDGCFVKAYPAETTEAFLDGHVSAFAYLGGVPQSILYDNTRLAVAKILGDGRRQRTRAFTELQSHYPFEDRFGRPGKGNDKGKVEGLVGYVRRNFLVPVPSFESFDALNAYLERRCLARMDARLRGHSESIGQRMERDLEALLPLPPVAYDACEKQAGRVSSLSLVRYRTNDYSAPVAYGHRDVLVRGYADEVVISCGSEVIARHHRSYELDDFVYDPIHYLPLLEKKTGALDQAAPLQGWALPEEFGTLRRLLESRNSTPARCRPSITCSPWVSPLESRSMWVTTRVSPSTTRSSSSKRPPRSFLAPLVSSARIFPREQPARTSRSTCRSRFLSSGSLTETLA